MTQRRAPAALATLVAGAMAVSACAPAARTDWSPPAWEASAVHMTTAVPEIDAGTAGPLASALIPIRIRNDEVGIQARVATLPDSATTATFNASVVQVVRTAIEGGVAASGIGYTPTVAPPGSAGGLEERRCVSGSTSLSAADLLADAALGPADATGTAVVCGIVAASGSLIGQRLRVVTGSPESVTGDTTTILYADVTSGETVAAEGLWAEGAVDALSTDIVEALRRGFGALSRRDASAGDEAQLAAVRAALRTTVPSADGLVITLAPGFTAPDLAGLGAPTTTEPISFAIPPEVATHLVSPFGARVLASIGQPYSGPQAAPAGTRRVDCTLVPCVAVTYDDGPSTHTPGILDELAARDAAATFFALGQNAQGSADTLARMTGEGHEVESHTWNHPRLPLLSAAQVRAQIEDSARALEAASGQRITAFRPPYGEYTPAVLAAAGMPAILWDVDTLDWQRPAKDVLIARAVDQPRPGSIVLLHDVHAGTADATGAILDGLLDRGFVLVTVRQLFGGELPASGAWRRAP